MRNRRSYLRLPSLGLIVIMSILQSWAQDPRKSFPFTAEEDADGARCVWSAFGQTGYPYGYVSAAAFPTSDAFLPVKGGKPFLG